MNNLGKAIGLILFMGIILTSCLLLVSKPKDQVVTVTEFPQDGVKVSKVAPISEFERNQITISVMHELDSLDNIYRVEAGMQKIPTEVFNNYCVEVMNHYKGQIQSIFYDQWPNKRYRFLIKYRLQPIWDANGYYYDVVAVKHIVRRLVKRCE